MPEGNEDPYLLNSLNYSSRTYNRVVEISKIKIRLSALHDALGEGKTQFNKVVENSIGKTHRPRRPRDQKLRRGPIMKKFSTSPLRDVKLSKIIIITPI